MNCMKAWNFLEKKLLFFLEITFLEMIDAGYKVKQDGTEQEEREQRAAALKILTPKNA